MPTRWLLTGAVVCVAVIGRLYAQPVPNPVAGGVQVIDFEYEIKAKYLYYLAMFVKPTAPEANPTADVVIAVIGPSSRLEQEVRSKPAYRSLKDRRVDWRWYVDVEAFKAAYPKGSMAPLPRVVFLMMPASSQSMDDVAKATTEYLEGASVLLVTEDDEQFRKSVAVNIFEDKAANRLKMQLRQSSLRERNLDALEAFLKSPAVLLY